MFDDTTTILIVDDQLFIRQMLESILKQFGDIKQASSGEEALEVMKNLAPDIILLDVTMPGIDGFKVCETLKADERTQNIPIVFLTANETNKYEERALDVGATDFIRKPISPAIVKARVSNILKLQEATRQLKILALTDPLTGAYNRRHFITTGTAELERFRRHESQFSLMMLDIDHFKSVNDTYGHDVGDEALIETVKVVQEQLRTEDTLGRLGGEEFAVILPETNKFNAAIVAERVRTAVSNITIPTSKGDLQFTVSIGLAEISRDDEVIEDIMKNADSALYDAKEGGRNKVVLFSS